METPSPIRLTGDVERKYMGVAINVSDTATPRFLVVGYKITGSTMDLNPDIENGTDIRGVNYASVNKFEPSQTFEPHRMTGGDDGLLGARLLHMFRYREHAALSKFQCIHIWGMLGTAGAYEADLYDRCTISINSIGGESWTDMPFTVTYGGEVTHGTVDKLIDEVDFTSSVF